MEESFTVEIPRRLDWKIGDVVQTTIPIRLGHGFVLGRGIVVKIDPDPSQELLPLCFVRGNTTHITTAIYPENLERVIVP